MLSKYLDGSSEGKGTESRERRPLAQTGSEAELRLLAPSLQLLPHTELSVLWLLLPLDKLWR